MFMICLLFIFSTETLILNPPICSGYEIQKCSGFLPEEPDPCLRSYLHYIDFSVTIADILLLICGPKDLNLLHYQ